MMKNVLSLVGAIAIVVIIGGGAHNPFGSAAGAQQTPPKAISELPITQHFSYVVNLNNITTSPTVAQMPLTTGMAISQFTVTSGGGPNHIIARVNGVPLFKGMTGFTYGSEVPPFVVTLNPPLIIRPGQTLELGMEGGGRELTISGYVLAASDFGL